MLLCVRFAATAFSLSAAYDSAIATWFAGQLDGDREGEGTKGDADAVTTMSPNMVTRMYKPEFALKYGCNPHQNP